jgi:aspartate aminotransferase
MISPSQAVSSIGASETVKLSEMVAALKAKGKDVLSLTMGEPDFPTPKNIVDAAKKALDDGHTHYTSSYGIEPLRQAVAEKCKKDNGLDCKWQDVLITPTKFAIAAAISAFCERGDEVLIPDPSWVSYSALTHLAGGKVVPVMAGEDVNFEMDPDKVNEKVSKRTKIMILNSPCNPTGGVASLKRLKGLAQIAQDHDLLVLSDEIYEKILYSGKHLSIGALPGMADRTITVNGFSKAYAMTGWRVGYLVAKKPLLDQVMKVQQHYQTCATSFAQYGALEALKGPQEPIQQMVDEFRKRRDLVVPGLNKIPGIKCFNPNGAFYAFFKYDFEVPSEHFCLRLLEEGGLGLVHGSAFGSNGEGYVRVSYAASQEKLKEALKRLEEFVKKL